MAILPEILLLILAVLILVIDPFWKNINRRINLGWLTVGGLAVVALISILAGRPGDAQSVLGGMVRWDWLGFNFKIFFIFSAAITAMFMMDVEHVARRAEAYLLLIASTIGMSLMVSAADIIMLYLAIETTSIPLYVLAGFLKQDERSVESGFKYLLFGALTSTILLYGFSLLFGLSGQTNIDKLSGIFTTFSPLSFGVLLLVLVGLAFKVSLFPFHFWAPDVYEGAPTPLAGFLSTASKAAGFVVVLRLFVVVFPGIAANWTVILSILATLTMTVGNLLAISQKNIKRMLAYSSIAHAGYAMIGVVAFSKLGVSGTAFYLIAYILTNLAAFGAVSAIGKVTGSDDMKAYYGLQRRAPGLALVMLVAFLSLAGMPPFGGFVAKVFVFSAAIQQGWIWLAVVGVINSIIGLYYYLTVLKYVYLYRMEGEEEEKHPIKLSRPYAIALTVLSLGILLVGVFFAPWYTIANTAALNLF
ncbi:MAG TPA: NADH-quinone oxidoreductase subunit N [Anaerolineales bacterium]|nr:NADH-quinone oxidoreductase subunit N [Anaerolineales bacterium]